MKTAHIIYAALGLAALVGISVAQATDVKPELSVLRGAAEIQKVDGSWADAQSVPMGSWLRSSKSDTTVRLPGLTMRLEPGASVRVSHVNGTATKIDAKGGRIFVKVAAQSTCTVSTTSRQIQASESEFVVDSGPEQKLYVLSGHARLDNQATSSVPLSAWSKAAPQKVAMDGPAGLDDQAVSTVPSNTSSKATPKQVALDGADVRKRKKNKRKFVLGEENKGRRIGEDVAPSPVASTVPPVEPTVPTGPPPVAFLPAVPAIAAAALGTGSTLAAVIGGVAGAGGIVAATTLLNNSSSDVNNDAQNAVITASQ